MNEERGRWRVMNVGAGRDGVVGVMFASGREESEAEEGGRARWC